MACWLGVRGLARRDAADLERIVVRTTKYEIGRESWWVRLGRGMGPEDIAVGYKQLLEVERGWRDMKQVIDLRPVYHRLEARIRAHVTLCWLALLLIRIIETSTSEGAIALGSLAGCPRGRGGFPASGRGDRRGGARSDRAGMVALCLSAGWRNHGGRAPGVAIVTVE